MNFCVLVVCLINIVSAFSVVYFGDEVLVLRLLLGGLAVDSLVMIVGVFGEASQVYVTSLNFHLYAKRFLVNQIGKSSRCYKSRRYILRHMKSWYLIRIGFFSSNFFDQTTPLVLADFCIISTINLLLLDR